MNVPLVSQEFFKEVKSKNIIAVASFEGDLDFISSLVDLSKKENKEIYYIPINPRQAKHLHFLNQKVISLNEKEIDVAFEVADQVDNYNNFIKIKTNSFIRDKMISQSALKLFVYVDSKNYVQDIGSDVCVEISTFAWQRTVIHLQSFGVAKALCDLDGSFIKTEIGHYLIKIKLDKNITLDDFEYSVRNIPGVLETGVFLGLVDVLFLDNKKDGTFEIRKKI